MNLTVKIKFWGILLLLFSSCANQDQNNSSDVNLIEMPDCKSVNLGSDDSPVIYCVELSKSTDSDEFILLFTDEKDNSSFSGKYLRVYGSEIKGKTFDFKPFPGTALILVSNGQDSTLILETGQYSEKYHLDNMDTLFYTPAIDSQDTSVFRFPVGISGPVYFKKIPSKTEFVTIKIRNGFGEIINLEYRCKNPSKRKLIVTFFDIRSGIIHSQFNDCFWEPLDSKY